MVASKKGTWTQAWVTFLSPLILILCLRWAIVEPFVIPSESMVPNLLVHDHILVKKFSFGLKVPFVDQWLVRWGAPQPGDIVVFKYPPNPSVYYVKRLVGLPGDKIEVRSGRILRNGQMFSYTPTPDKEFHFQEHNGLRDYTVLVHSESDDQEGTVYEVPENQYFVMGDNRDNSSDSRVWGFVSAQFLVGKSWMIWLSCQETLEDARFICDPLKMRWNRMFNFL
ncbi:MAG: signal peptidase I [Bdellovibrionaceae bacterium]|nr:signal peptidase I [Pseudobdellovibrionaceae bacterium]